MSDSFRGLYAMLRHRRRLIFEIPLLAGLGLGLVVGFLFFLSAGRVDELPELVYGLLLLGSVALPLLAGTNLTVVGSNQQAGSLRRQELLAMPMGRLVIPATVTLTTFAMFFGVAALFVVGLSLVLGPAAVFGSFAEVATGSPARAFGAVGGLFVSLIYFNFLAALGTSDALWVMLAPAWLAAICAPMTEMGYSEEDQFAFTAALTATLAAAYLVLPFVLYGRRRLHWAHGKRGGAFETIDLYGLVTTFTALMAWGLLGFGWTVVGVVVVGAALVLRRRRKLPTTERRVVPGLRVAHGFVALAVLPVLLYGLVTDHQRVAAVGFNDESAIRGSLCSPDGRYLAVQLVNRGARPNYGEITRVGIVDLTAERPSRLLDPRYGRLVGWSADSRQLVFDDRSVGRIRGGSRHGLSITDDWRAGFAATFSSAAETFAYDLEADAVRSLGRREIAHGWKRPEELAQLSATFSSEFVVTDGEGREFVLPRTKGNHLRVDRYEGGQPVVLLGEDPKPVLLTAAGEQVELPAPAPFDAQRPAPLGDGWERVLIERIKTTKTGEPSLRYAIRRAEVEHRLPLVAWTRHQLHSDGSLLFRDAEGLKRLLLPGGEVQPLVSAPWEGPGRVQTRQATVGGPFLVERPDGTSLRVLPDEAWRVEPIHLPFKLDEVVTLHGQRAVFVTEAGRYRVFNLADNSVRPLF